MADSGRPEFVTAVSATRSPLPRSVQEILRAAGELVDPGLRHAVDRLPRAIRHLAGYHFSWWDQHGTPGGAASGKAVRPALVLLACQAMQGQVDQAMPAALARCATWPT